MKANTPLPVNGPFDDIDDSDFDPFAEDSDDGFDVDSVGVMAYDLDEEYIEDEGYDLEDDEEDDFDLYEEDDIVYFEGDDSDVFEIDDDEDALSDAGFHYDEEADD